MRDVHARGGGDRLADHGRDGVGPFVEYRPLDLARAFEVTPPVGSAERVAVLVRPLHAHSAVGKRAVLGAVVAPAAAKAEGAGGRAVVGAAAADELVAPRFTAAAMELLRHLHRGLDGFGAAADEEDTRGRIGGQGGDPRGEPQGRRAHAAVGRVAELADLRVYRVRDLAPAMPDVAEPHAGQGVEVAPVLVVVHPDPVAAGHDLHLGRGGEVAGRAGVRPEMGLAKLD